MDTQGPSITATSLVGPSPQLPGLDRRHDVLGGDRPVDRSAPSSCPEPERRPEPGHRDRTSTLSKSRATRPTRSAGSTPWTRRRRVVHAYRRRDDRQGPRGNRRTGSAYVSLVMDTMAPAAAAEPGDRARRRDLRERRSDQQHGGDALGHARPRRARRSTPSTRPRGPIGTPTSRDEFSLPIQFPGPASTNWSPRHRRRRERLARRHARRLRRYPAPLGCQHRQPGQPHEHAGCDDRAHPLRADPPRHFR